MVLSQDIFHQYTYMLYLLEPRSVLLAFHHKYRHSNSVNNLLHHICLGYHVFILMIYIYNLHYNLFDHHIVRCH